MTTFALTVLTNKNGIATKRLSLDAEGNIVKTPAAAIYQGIAERRTFTLVELPKLLRSLEPNQCLVHGVCQYDIAAVVTETNYTPGQRIGGLPVVPRTAKCFSYEPGKPALMMLDVDAIPGKPSLTADEVLSILEPICPGMGSAGIVVTPSTSSCIYLGDKQLKGQTGLHIYIVAQDGADIPRLGKVLFRRLWLMGYGHIVVSKAGGMLLRTVIDESVFKAERIDFAAGAVCADGLEQRLPFPVLTKGGVLDTTKTIDLSDDELALGKKLVADAKQAQEPEAALIKGKYIEGQAVELLNKGNGSVTLEAARLAIESRLGGELMPDDWLYFDATGEVQVRVVLANLAQYNLQTMSDPLEPDSGQCKAILYANIGHGEPIIHSFSHGGQNYKFAKRKMWTCDDAREAVYALAAERALETAAEGSPEDIAFIKRIKSLYTDIFQSNDFDEADQDEMRALCKKKFKCNKETLDDIAKAARGKGGASGGGSGKPVESITAAKLLPGVEYDWLYEGKTGRYFQYNGAGLWEVSGNVAFLGLVKKRMETHDDIIEYGFKEAFLNGVEGLLSIDLCGDLTAQPHNLIPFRNGVLDIKTGKKIEHAAENHLTWQLAFDYQRSATCLFFQTWLLQRLGSEERVILIRAIIGAILMGLADLQFFVELQGTAGAGKSVFQWLLSQLVGEKNIGTTDLERLEKERFEAAGLVGKRMILISDSKSWAGEVPKLKAITGNDLIPIERKHQQQNGEGAMIDGIVVVATNPCLTA